MPGTRGSVFSLSFALSRSAFASSFVAIRTSSRASASSTAREIRYTVAANSVARRRASECRRSSDALRDLGIPNQRARTSAIRHLLLQTPAPVIAKALGYHDKTATRLVTEASGTWSRYAPGDHAR